MSQFEGRSYTHRKYRKPEVYRRKSIDVSKRPLPELHQNDRISNLWVANPFTLFVEGSLAELNSIVSPA
jgi:hypothetical protein